MPRRPRRRPRRLQRPEPNPFQRHTFPPRASRRSAMSPLATAIKFFQDCGLFIYPSLLIMATGVSIAIERFMFLQRARVANRNDWSKYLPMLQNGQWKEVLGRTATSDSAIGKIVHNGLTR